MLPLTRSQEVCNYHLLFVLKLQVCDVHAFDVIKPHIDHLYKKVTGNKSFKREDFIRLVPAQCMHQPTLISGAS
jgi:hypothetical protein